MTSADAHSTLFAALDLVADGAIVVRGVVEPGATSTTWYVDHCNSTAARLLALGRGGPGPARPLGIPLELLLPENGDLDVLAELDQARLTGIPRRGNQTWRARDGTVLASVEYVAGPLPDRRSLLVLRDREAAPTATAVEVLGADRDGLTGLPGRAVLRQAIATAQQTRDSGGRGFALVLVGLDGMAAVNADEGYDVGDSVLKEFAARLRGLLRGSDTVARLDSDRFGLVVGGLDNDADAEALRDRLAAELLRDTEREGRVVPVSASAGLVLDARPDVDPDDLMAQAESAMLEAKSGGYGSLAVFDDAVRPRLGRLVTARELARATESSQLRLHYQPVVDVPEGRSAGCEALLRWAHPTRGLLAPPDFLSAAEASEEIVRIGAWVIDEALAQVARWERVADLDYYRVGINIAPRQLIASDVVGLVAAALERHGVSGDRLILEIVESDAFDIRSAAAAQIRALRSLGLRVAIDDFGAGHTGMGWLRDLPVDVIKVDRALVGLKPTDRERAILSAIVSIGDAIGADVLLEGVEDPEQFEVARDVGVRFAQGLLFGAPVPASDDQPVRPIGAA